jgi:O-antigen ligase
MRNISFHSPASAYFARAVEHKNRWLPVAATGAVLGLAVVVGSSGSLLVLGFLLGVAALLITLRQLQLGLLAVIVVALVLARPIGTGSDVNLYPVALLVPALFAIWFLGSALRRHIWLPPSPVHLPLLLFLGASLLSLAIGSLTWDPFVPRKDNFILVQFAQWAIFAFSACTFWLTSALAQQEIWLKRMTAVFLLIGGVLVLLRIWPPAYPLFLQISSGAAARAPFWLLLVALAGGQVLFNRRLHVAAQLALLTLIGSAAYFALLVERAAAAYWVGIAVACAVLVWLRFPRLRVPVVLLTAILLLLGGASQVVWDFAGGEGEWNESGASRLVLIERVIEVTMRNPVTGLGPAAYRPYANVKPLLYQQAFWIAPTINSHNNYVDLFAHSGLLGLGLFLWFMAEVARLGLRLRRRYQQGFLAGYVNSMLATLASVLVIMLLLDWFLPFVYNVGFYGFQASVLVWLFLGGLVAIDYWPAPEPMPASA